MAITTAVASADVVSSAACSLRRNWIVVTVAMAIATQGIRIDSMDCIHSLSLLVVILQAADAAAAATVVVMFVRRD